MHTHTHTHTYYALHTHIPRHTNKCNPIRQIHNSTHTYTTHTHTQTCVILHTHMHTHPCTDAYIYTHTHTCTHTRTHTHTHTHTMPPSLTWGQTGMFPCKTVVMDSDWWWLDTPLLLKHHSNVPLLHALRWSLYPCKEQSTNKTFNAVSKTISFARGYCLW